MPSCGQVTASSDSFALWGYYLRPHPALFAAIVFKLPAQSFKLTQFAPQLQQQNLDITAFILYRSAAKPFQALRNYFKLTLFILVRQYIAAVGICL